MTTRDYTIHNLYLDEVMPARAALVIARAANAAIEANRDYDVPVEIEAKLTHWIGQCDTMPLDELRSMLTAFVPQYMMALATGEVR